MRLVSAVLAILILMPVLGYGALVAAVGRDAVWPALFGQPERPPIDFTAPPLRTSPNRWLVCPDGWCADGRDAASPVFAVPLPALEAAWDRVMAEEPHTTVLANGSGGGDADQRVYELRTPLLRFPDTLWVQFVDLDAAGSSLAVLSRSHIGYDDFGTNRTRVERLLTGLAARLPIAATSAD